MLHLKKRLRGSFNSSLFWRCPVSISSFPQDLVLVWGFWGTAHKLLLFSHWQLNPALFSFLRNKMYWNLVGDSFCFLPPATAHISFQFPGTKSVDPFKSSSSSKKITEQGKQFPGRKGCTPCIERNSINFTGRRCNNLFGSILTWQPCSIQNPASAMSFPKCKAMLWHSNSLCQPTSPRQTSLEQGKSHLDLSQVGAFGKAVVVSCCNLQIFPWCKQDLFLQQQQMLELFVPLLLGLMLLFPSLCGRHFSPYPVSCCPEFSLHSLFFIP